MLNVACPNCQKRYKIDEKLGGKRVPCKACGTPIDIPKLEPIAAESNPDDLMAGLLAASQAETGPASSAAPAASPTDAASHPCPSCGRPFPPANRVCMICGYNRAIKKAVQSPASPAPSQPSTQAQFQPQSRLAASAANQIRPNRPYNNPQLALTDGWATPILFYLGLLILLAPLLQFLYDYFFNMPPLPRGYWMVIFLTVLNYILTMFALPLLCLSIAVKLIDLCGAGLRFELPDEPFKRMVAACALPLLAYNLVIYIYWRMRLGLNTSFLDSTLISLSPMGGYLPYTQATIVSLAVAAGTFFFIYRINNLDYLFSIIIVWFFLVVIFNACPYLFAQAELHVVGWIAQHIIENLGNNPNHL